MESDPDLSHISCSDYEHVYEPAEDSYLMMDALKKDIQWLSQRIPDFPVCFEVGIGSGILSTYLSDLITPTRGYFLATDYNPRATEIARKTFVQNKVRGDIVLTDLVAGLELTEKIDVMLFNPPYVPTPPEEMEGDGISISWAGGSRGREVLDRLLPSIPGLLSRFGVLYMVVLDENDPAELAEIFAKSGLEVYQKRNPVYFSKNYYLFANKLAELQAKAHTDLPPARLCLYVPLTATPAEILCSLN